MGSQTYEHKLGSMFSGTKIKLDASREQYVQDKIKELAKSGKLGEYLTALIRISMSDPTNSGANEAFIQSVIDLGMTGETKKFLDKCSDELADMHSKIDAVYNMCVDMYTLVKFKGMLGLDGAVKAPAASEFMCKRLINKFCQSLDIDDYTLFESDKLGKVEETSDRALEYILESYGDIVNELKACRTVETITVERTIESKEDTPVSSNTPVVSTPAQSNVAEKVDGNAEIEFGDDSKPDVGQSEVDLLYNNFSFD